MSLEKEIQESIRQNLPQQVGEALQIRLKEAEEDKEALKKAVEGNTAHLKVIRELQAELAKHSELSQRERDIKEKETYLNELLLKQELDTIKYQLAVEKEKSQFTKDVALGLVRNTIYRTSILDSENQAGYYNGTQFVTPSPINKSLTETKTEE